MVRRRIASCVLLSALLLSACQGNVPVPNSSSSVDEEASVLDIDDLKALENSKIADIETTNDGKTIYEVLNGVVEELKSGDKSTSILWTNANYESENHGDSWKPAFKSTQMSLDGKYEETFVSFDYHTANNSHSFVLIPLSSDSLINIMNYVLIRAPYADLYVLQDYLVADISLLCYMEIRNPYWQLAVDLYSHFEGMCLINRDCEDYPFETALCIDAEGTGLNLVVYSENTAEYIGKMENRTMKPFIVINGESTESDTEKYHIDIPEVAPEAWYNNNYGVVYAWHIPNVFDASLSSDENEKHIESIVEDIQVFMPNTDFSDIIQILDGHFSADNLLNYFKQACARYTEFEVVDRVAYSSISDYASLPEDSLFVMIADNDDSVHWSVGVKDAEEPKIFEAPYHQYRVYGDGDICSAIEFGYRDQSTGTYDAINGDVIRPRIVQTYCYDMPFTAAAVQDITWNINENRFILEADYLNILSHTEEYETGVKYITQLTLPKEMDAYTYEMFSALSFNKSGKFYVVYGNKAMPLN